MKFYEYLSGNRFRSILSGICHTYFCAFQWYSLLMAFRHEVCRIFSRAYSGLSQCTERSYFVPKAPNGSTKFQILPLSFARASFFFYKVRRFLHRLFSHQSEDRRAYSLRPCLHVLPPFSPQPKFPKRKLSQMQSFHNNLTLFVAKILNIVRFSYVQRMLFYCKYLSNILIGYTGLYPGNLAFRRMYTAYSH